MLPQGWGKRPALVGGSRRPENSPDGTHLGASSGWVGKGWPKEERRHGYQPKFTSPFPLISADLLSLPFSHSLGVSLSLPLCSCPPHTPPQAEAILLGRTRLRLESRSLEQEGHIFTFPESLAWSRGRGQSESQGPRHPCPASDLLCDLRLVSAHLWTFLFCLRRGLLCVLGQAWNLSPYL
jgi:hypothetical protein